MMRLQLFAAALVALGSVAAIADSMEQDASCSQDVLGSSLAPTSAALLQKFVHRGLKMTLAQEQPPQSEDNLDDTACTGYQAQGTCWFLSKLGDSCNETCKLQGRSFSYTVADPNAPVIPALVGHEPSGKQEAWAALECYVPSEDRYHPANKNAARHYDNNTGSWSHENCKLACPCAGAESDRCSWSAPPACASEFMWKGVKYVGCASVDLEHERPWCQHNFQRTDKDSDNYAADWSYCSYSCPTEQPTAPSQSAPAKPVTPSLPEKNCEWMPAYSCVREFDYKGTHFVGCTSIDHDAPWCSNEQVYKGSWNSCTYTCKQKEETVPSQETLCSWQPKPQCASTFEYKGAEYTGCTAQDYLSPWCSVDRIHKGAWETCTRVCTAPTKFTPVPQAVYPTPDPKQAVYPVPQPANGVKVTSTISGSGDPCDKSDVENDIIGNSAPLNEAGYQTVSAASSPLNMKRFICRVISSIGCRVVDLPPLLAFAPYHSREISNDTYKNLESELTALCHDGGRWVVPQLSP